MFYNEWLYGLIINGLKGLKMITKDEQIKLRSTIALLSSMVNGREQHTEQSRKEVIKALSIVDNLPIQRVSNSLICEWCDKPATVHINGNIACDEHANYC